MAIQDTRAQGNETQKELIDAITDFVKGFIT